VTVARAKRGPWTRRRGRNAGAKPRSTVDAQSANSGIRSRQRARLEERGKTFSVSLRAMIASPLARSDLPTGPACTANGFADLRVVPVFMRRVVTRRAMARVEYVGSVARGLTCSQHERHT
jgi:hypothetical protein